MSTKSYYNTHCDKYDFVLKKGGDALKIEIRNELREFNCMYKEIEDLYHEAALKSGLSDSSHLVLYSIAELGDGCQQIDIVNRYSISKQTISSSIRSLEKKGYICLKHGKKRDMHLYLTPAGEEFVRENIIPLMEIENSVFSAMEQEEVREFLRLNRKYNEIFKEKMSRLLESGR